MQSTIAARLENKVGEKIEGSLKGEGGGEEASKGEKAVEIRLVAGKRSRQPDKAKLGRTGWCRR